VGGAPRSLSASRTLSLSYIKKLKKAIAELPKWDFLRLAGELFASHFSEELYATPSAWTRKSTRWCTSYTAD